MRTMAKTNVVFIKDAPPHGRAGDIKDVAGGFFRNFLLPRNSAVLATSDRVKQAEAMLRKRERAEEDHRARMETYAKELEGATIEFVKKANEQGGLFDALDKREILAALHQKGFTGIEEKHIDLDRPFDKIGEYTVNLQLGPARTTEVTSPTESFQRVRSGGENLPTPSVKIVIKKEE